jgi:hypothetical protein
MRNEELGMRNEEFRNSDCGLRIFGHGDGDGLNSKLRIENSKLKTQNSKLKTQNSKLKTLDSKLPRGLPKIILRRQRYTPPNGRGPLKKL